MVMERMNQVLCQPFVLFSIHHHTYLCHLLTGTFWC